MIVVGDYGVGSVEVEDLYAAFWVRRGRGVRSGIQCIYFSRRSLGRSIVRCISHGRVFCSRSTGFPFLLHACGWRRGEVEGDKEALGGLAMDPLAGKRERDLPLSRSDGTRIPILSLDRSPGCLLPAA